MLLPNLVFDVLVFGALILAAALDWAFPGLGGALGMLAVGGALYIASQEMCEGLQARKLWSSESLATSLAPIIAGIVFFWGRNGSDFALLLLSIGLMMSALMTTIGAIAALGAVWREKSATPLLGLLLTLGGSVALGLTGGLLTLSSPLLLGVSVLGYIAWKLRERVSKFAPNTPAENEPSVSEAMRGSAKRVARTAAEVASAGVGGAVGGGLANQLLPTPDERPMGRPLLVPQRGTLFHRLLPVLVLGLLGFLALRGARVGSVLGLDAPAVAAR